MRLSTFPFGSTGRFTLLQEKQSMFPGCNDCPNLEHQWNILMKPQSVIIVKLELDMTEAQFETKREEIQLRFHFGVGQSIEEEVIYIQNSQNCTVWGTFGYCKVSFVNECGRSGTSIKFVVMISNSSVASIIA